MKPTTAFRAILPSPSTIRCSGPSAIAGWIETGDIIKHGITQSYALEVGPGPGYLGLEWLKQTQGTRLKGLDISPDMIALAEKNARDYGLTDRVEYVCSNAATMPFDDTTFDAVFTNGSLHEWATPRRTFDEIGRVLKPGGRVFISDLRRDIMRRCGGSSGWAPRRRRSAPA